MKKDKGSITIEAAIVIPFFIIVMTSIMNFFIIINYQNIMQFNIVKTSLSVGRLSYTMDRLEGLNDKENAINNIGADRDLLYTGLSTVYVYQNIFTEELNEYTDKSGIKNGKRGVLVTFVTDDNNFGVNDIKVNYRMKFNTIGTRNRYLNMMSRVYFRSWIGERISDKSEEGESFKEEGKKVYITQNGKVYHLNKNCTYINISVVKVKLDYVGNFRNESGGKYYKCETCIKNNSDIRDEVYITANGTRYHSRDNCVRIERNIIEVDLSEIGNRRVCSKCDKNK